MEALSFWVWVLDSNGEGKRLLVEAGEQWRNLEALWRTKWFLVSDLITNTQSDLSGGILTILEPRETCGSSTPDGLGDLFLWLWKGWKDSGEGIF
jgi:hypothetical protein